MLVCLFVFILFIFYFFIWKCIPALLYTIGSLIFYVQEEWVEMLARETETAHKLVRNALIEVGESHRGATLTIQVFCSVLFGNF